MNESYIAVPLTMIWALIGVVPTVLFWRLTWKTDEPTAAPIGLLVCAILFGPIASLVSFLNYMAYKE
ncbi:MAG: hypothetical protein IMZ70_01330 [Candidatus Atribacteria bacterium]|nr:hypothetical protein [Candidatus Atribacteria bacterium]MBE3145004.1 hypothetical protein [Planctomycetota bacterium]